VSAFKPVEIPDGIFTINGKPYMRTPKWGYEPLEGIPPQQKLEDETVRKIMGFAVALSEQLARFKEHLFDDIGALEALLAQEYDAKLGGKKGNMTLMSFDGLYKVQVQVADRIAFGPELQAAKALFDECLMEWSADARAEIRALVTDAFNTDKEGTINRSLIFMLLRRQSDDPRWQRGQDAIRDAMRIVGSTIYARCYRREFPEAKWRPVSLDIAKL